MSTKNIPGAIVPGLPHVLCSDLNSGYRALHDGMVDLGKEWAESGVERIVYYSTQWISVLGHSFQTRPAIKGTHVDDNWYELGDLPYSFRVNTAAANTMMDKARALGYQCRAVDYEHFPIDTGTIIADSLLNKGRFQTNMVSCCVYSDYEDTKKLAGCIGATVSDGKTAFVGVTGLSGRYFTTEIDLREDRVNSPEDQRWDQKILQMMADGKWVDLQAQLPAYTKTCKVDMGLKALAFLQGCGVIQAETRGKILAYAGLYGTGGAVVRF